jgi:hypothetical protein
MGSRDIHNPLRGEQEFNWKTLNMSMFDNGKRMKDFSLTKQSMMAAFYC